LECGFNVTFERASVAGFAGALASLFVACGGSDEPVPLIWLSSGDMTAPAFIGSNAFRVDAMVNGRSTAKVIVDTGAPYSLLEMGPYKGEVQEDVGTVDSLTIGGVTLLHVPTVGQDLRDPSRGGGLVGFTAFGQFAVSFNYRDRVLSLGGSPAPDGLEPDSVSIPFALEGGGYGPVRRGGRPMQIPASRVVIPVLIEGEQHEVLVDTGASFVGLRKSVFDNLAADGRGKVEEHVQLASSVSTTTVMRLRSVTIEGTSIVDVPAASSATDPASNAPGMEDLLDSLTNELGRPVDGLLGGVVLREFFVTVGYPEGRLSLRRYTARDHIRDHYRRVGIELAISSKGPPFTYAIGQIYDGTDAARQLEALGIRAGGDVLSVDDQPLPPDDPNAADAMLLGAVGETHRVGFNKATLTLLVEDLLLLP
jgi:hypothetical protein